MTLPTAKMVGAAGADLVFLAATGTVLVSRLRSRRRAAEPAVRQAVGVPTG